MERRDVLILAGIVTAFVLLALSLPMAKADTFAVPGDLTVGDDVTITDDVNIGGSASITGQASFPTYSCPDILQMFVIKWDESSQAGKAYPDTFLGNMEPRAVYAARIPGYVDYVDMFMDTAGSGWDSLKLDVLASATGDTSMFTTTPMLEAADGDRAVTSVDGRDGALSPVQKHLDKGEVLYIDADLFGNKGDPPAGIIVWIYFRPDYTDD